MSEHKKDLALKDRQLTQLQELCRRLKKDQSSENTTDGDRAMDCDDEKFPASDADVKP